MPPATISALEDKPSKPGEKVWPKTVSKYPPKWWGDEQKPFKWNDLTREKKGWGYPPNPEANLYPVPLWDLSEYKEDDNFNKNDDQDTSEDDMFSSEEVCKTHKPKDKGNPKEPDDKGNPDEKMDEGENSE